VTRPRPLLLDASVLVAYERERTRRTQAFVVQAITDGRTLVTSALSLALAAAELAGQHRELRWLVDDSKEPLQVLSLSSMNALDVGTLAAQASTVDAVSLELAQVVHEAVAIRAIVLTYEPKLYQGQPVDVMDMRPR
jgi:predicted nucleic acid-binding protein